MTPGRGRRVLIIVQNLPVPFDRRVWLECRTLAGAGYSVAVVCPKGPGDPSYQVLDGVELYKYRAHPATGGAASFFAEYLHSFLATLWLTAKASRRGRFDAIQSCNPPTSFGPSVCCSARLHGSRFVFDHHDLCPETYELAVPGRLAGPVPRAAPPGTPDRWAADHVISTNGSYRSLVSERHGLDGNQVTVVRTGPDSSRLKPTSPVPDLRRGRPHLVAYIGVMGPQDGVNIVLEVAELVVNRWARDDISFTLIGSGDCFDELVEMRDRLGLRDVVEFTGRVPDETVAAILSSADVGMSPDPKNPLNDLSTMNKTMEYMAFGLPVIAFDLRETRVSAGGAGAYATPNDVEELAQLLLELIDDPDRRRSMGALGRTRVETELDWSHQAPRYLEVYERLLSAGRGSDLAPPLEPVG